MPDNRPYDVQVVDQRLTYQGRLTEVVIDQARRLVWVSNPHDRDRLARLAFDAGMLVERVERKRLEEQLDAQGVPPDARPAIREEPGIWAAWLNACDAMAEADADDCSIEDFADFFGLFKRLMHLGMPFAPSFVANVERLGRSALNTSDDDDQDSDFGIDDENEGDASDQWLEDGDGDRPELDPEDIEDPRCWAEPGDPDDWPIGTLPRPLTTDQASKLREMVAADRLARKGDS